MPTATIVDTGSHNKADGMRFTLAALCRVWPDMHRAVMGAVATNEEVPAFVGNVSIVSFEGCNDINRGRRPTFSRHVYGQRIRQATLFTGPVYRTQRWMAILLDVVVFFSRAVSEARQWMMRWLYLWLNVHLKA